MTLRIFRTLFNKVPSTFTVSLSLYSIFSASIKDSYSKQFLLIKNIKKAKTLLSDPRNEKDSCVLLVEREVSIETSLSKDELVECSKDVLEKIEKYIVDETNAKINADVTKIFIAGGVVETYRFMDDLKKAIKKKLPNIKVDTFEMEKKSSKGSLTIKENEDSTYGNALACLYIAINNIDIKLCLSLSYGTYFTDQSNNVKYLYCFASKGELLNENKVTVKLTDPSFISQTITEEIFSFEITGYNLNKGLISNKRNYRNGRYFIGEINSELRRNAESDIGLKLVSGGKGADLVLYSNSPQGRRKIISLVSDKLEFVEGISVDENGHAVPIVNLTNNNNIYNVVQATVEGFHYPVNIRIKDITIGFEGLKDFDVSGLD